MPLPFSSPTANPATAVPWFSFCCRGSGTASPSSKVNGGHQLADALQVGMIQVEPVVTNRNDHRIGSPE